MSGTVKLFGIPVAKMTEAEAVERIVGLAKRQAHDDKGAGSCFSTPVVPSRRVESSRRLTFRLRKEDARWTKGILSN